MNDDELDALLRSDTHIEDAGFTERLVERLPAPRRKAPRIAILLGATGLATVLALASSAPRGLSALLAGVQSANSFTPAIVIACVVAVLVGAGAQEAWQRT